MSCFIDVMHATEHRRRCISWGAAAARSAYMPVSNQSQVQAATLQVPKGAAKQRVLDSDDQAVRMRASFCGMRALHTARRCHAWTCSTLCTRGGASAEAQPHAKSATSAALERQPHPPQLRSDHSPTERQPAHLFQGLLDVGRGHVQAVVWRQLVRIAPEVLVAHAPPLARVRLARVDVQAAPGSVISKM